MSLLTKEDIIPYLKAKYPHMYQGNDDPWCRRREDALMLLLESYDVELLLDAQHAKDHTPSPKLREEIAKIFKIARQEDEIRRFADGLSDADDVIALIPDVLAELREKLTELEEKLNSREADLILAKKEEKGRIINTLLSGLQEGWEDEGGNPTMAIFLKPKIWQSLKEK